MFMITMKTSQMPESNIIELVDKLDSVIYEFGDHENESDISVFEHVDEGRRLINLLKLYINILINRNAEQAAIIEKIVWEIQQPEESDRKWSCEDVLETIKEDILFNYIEKDESNKET